MMGRYSVKRADGVTAVHRCDPLVTPAVQAAAITALEARRTGDNVTSRAIAKEDFSGALWCPCGTRTHRYYSGGRKRADGTVGPKLRRYVCKACGKSVNADAADAEVMEHFSSSLSPHIVMRLIPGDDNSAALERVQMELRELASRGLDEDEEDRLRASLRAEKRRLEGLPSTPARTVTEIARRADGTVITEGDHWTSLAMDERREWLLRGELQAIVRTLPGRTGKVGLSVDYLEPAA